MTKNGKITTIMGNLLVVIIEQGYDTPGAGMGITDYVYYGFVNDFTNISDFNSIQVGSNVTFNPDTGTGDHRGKKAKDINWHQPVELREEISK